jgi:hypothetical protein
MGGSLRTSDGEGLGLNGVGGRRRVVHLDTPGFGVRGHGAGGVVSSSVSRISGCSGLGQARLSAIFLPLPPSRALSRRVFRVTDGPRQRGSPASRAWSPKIGASLAGARVRG